MRREEHPWAAFALYYHFIEKPPDASDCHV
jgi:hypothetical protein